MASASSNHINLFFGPEGEYKAIDVFQFDIHVKGSSGMQVSTMTLKSNSFQNSSDAEMTAIKSSIPRAPQYINLPISSSTTLENSEKSFSFFSRSSLLKRSKSPLMKNKISNDSVTAVEPNTQENISSFIPQTVATASPNSKNAQVVQSVMVHEHLAKILSYRKFEHHYMFAQIGKTLMWLELNGIVREPLTHLYFKDSYVTCHDVNTMIKDRLEVVLGLSSGEVLTYYPLSAKFRIFNKQGCMTKSSATCIKWVPGSESLFMACFNDGKVFLMDKDKEHQSFEVDQNDNTSSFTVIKNPKSQKSNPITCWSFGKDPVTALAFSPDCQHVAVTTMCGKLHIIDYINNCLLDLYNSYFGGILAVAWSPDGRFIVTGGQDDLIAVYHFKGKLLARGEAHHSWVKYIEFDPYLCTDRIYRFASVGEDGKIVVWEFSIGSLRKLRQSTLKRNRTFNETSYSVPNHPIHHGFINRKQVPWIQPLCTHKIHPHPLSCIHFKENHIITSDVHGTIKVWTRPQEEEEELEKKSF